MSITRSLFCFDKWASAVSQKKISPTDKKNKLNQSFRYLYLQELLFDTSVNIFLNVTFSSPAAAQHANN